MTQVRMAQENMFRTIQNDVMRLQLAQNRTTTAISTNKQVNAPSDSVYSETILRSRLSLAEVDQYRLNLESANNWMKSSEDSMTSIVDRLTRAKALAEQMATGTYGADQQAATASEVSNLIDQIVTLANTINNGYYIFGGTRSNQAAIINALNMLDPAAVSDDSPAGHNTLASAYSSGGSYYLSLGRQTGGTANTLTVAAANTLGETGALGLSFDGATFAQTQTASTSPLQTDIYTSNQALLALTSLISDRLGEELTFTGSGAAQTFRTKASVTITAAGAGIGDTVTVGGDTYTYAAALAPNAAAAWLADQINNTAGLNYYATVSAGTVTLNAKAGSAFNVTTTGANITVDQDTTLQQLMNQINAGLKATGVIHIDGSAPANLPAAADTVTLGSATWNWGRICPARVSFSGAAAGQVQVTVNGDLYTVSGADAIQSAKNLADQINGDTALGYYAQVVGNTQVSIFSKAGGAYETAVETADPNNVATVTQPPPATAAAFAQDLTDFINSNSSTFTASLSGSGAGATVQITAKDVGAAGNVVLTVTNGGGGNTIASGSLLGGLDGADTTGHMQAAGASSLRLATTVQGEVLAVDSTTGDVSVRLSWYDDNGKFQTATYTIPAGESSAVTIPELGGIQLYRDSQNFKVGAVFQLDLGHYQGNDESLDVNFSNLNHMRYNWTASQLLGDRMGVTLDETSAAATREQTLPLSTGNVELSGIYRGVTPRDFTFDVIDGGQAPGDDVTLRAHWTDEDGQPHTKDMTFSRAGLTGCLALPVYGDTPKIDLTGDTATPAGGNTGTGTINLTGEYTGFKPRAITFSVVDAGQLPGDGVRLTATWTDDNGHVHSEDVTLSGDGASGAVEIPNSDGVKVYLDTGAFVAGETYTYNLNLSPHHGGEAIYVNLDNGDFKTGDSFHYQIAEQPVSILDTLKEWQYRLENGDQEAAQTQSQRTLLALNQAMQTILDYVADSGARQDRVTVRQGVMDDQVLYHGQNLEDLQDVDMTKAFLDLRAQQTAYNAALKVISVMSQLSLLNYL